MRAISADSASDVSGPVAMITGSRSLDSGIAVDLFANDGDQRMRGERLRDRLGEPLAIDRQRRAGRHAARLGGTHHERAEPPHLFFQQADGVVELVAAEGIAADELGEPIGLVHGGRTHRPHLVQRDRHAARRRLPRGLATRRGRRRRSEWSSARAFADGRLPAAAFDLDFAGFALALARFTTGAGVAALAVDRFAAPASAAARAPTPRPAASAPRLARWRTAPRLEQRLRFLERHRRRIDAARNRRVGLAVGDVRAVTALRAPAARCRRRAPRSCESRASRACRADRFGAAAARARASRSTVNRSSLASSDR